MKKSKNSNAKAQRQRSPLCCGGNAWLSLPVVIVSGGGGCFRTVLSCAEARGGSSLEHPQRPAPSLSLRASPLHA